MSADNSQETAKPRTRGRPFAPGYDPRRENSGRKPKDAEVAHAEAARRGAPPEEFERATAKMVALAQEGNVQAYSALVRVFGLGREELNAPTAEGESAAALLADPKNLDRIDELMTLIYAREPGSGLENRGTNPVSDVTA